MVFPSALLVLICASFSAFLALFHLSQAHVLLSSLAACLAGCQLLIYTGNILAVMAAYGLCQTEYNKQEIRFQTSLLADGKRDDSSLCCVVAL